MKRAGRDAASVQAPGAGATERSLAIGRCGTGEDSIHIDSLLHSPTKSCFSSATGER